MQNRLYVGNLAGDVAASSLQELFESHGFVMDVNFVGGDEVGQRHGFAFVTMATDESAVAAVKGLNGAQFARICNHSAGGAKRGTGDRGRSGGES